MPVGRVYLVGAGPGDPGLITLRGVECLARADVVMHDYLANPAILRHARPGAEFITLGNHRGGKIWSQEEINREMTRLALAGKTVVRLKGGDPAVFARGAEEAAELVRHNIPFEIVPGITAALAAGSCAGIPITHREFASAVALVTGHEDDDKRESALDYAALAKFPGTLVMYMGVTSAPIWTAALIAGGKPATTPAVIVRRCSLPDQLTIRCTLGEVAERLTQPKKIRPPVIVIIGEVARLGETLDWFHKRPLFGQRILVARPAEQCDELTGPLSELGAETIVQPAIEISAPGDWSKVDAAIDRIGEFDWLVFSSANGVRYFFNRLEQLGRDARALAGVKLAAIGPGTARELANYRLKCDAQPEEFRAESLASLLAADANGKKFLLARASRGREVLTEELTAAGGIVQQVIVYSSTDVVSPDAEVAQRMASGEIDWVLVTSSAIARSLVRLFGENLQSAKLASISPITSETLRELGFTPTAEATEYTMPGIIAAVVKKQISVV